MSGSKRGQRYLNKQLLYGVDGAWKGEWCCNNKVFFPMSFLEEVDSFYQNGLDIEIRRLRQKVSSIEQEISEIESNRLPKWDSKNVTEK